MQKLWNRNFSILTIGSFISALGSASAMMAFGYLIYRQTGSPFALALFSVANMVPRVLTGFLAGPFVDRHSRVKIIYTLDFFSTICFTGVAAILFFGIFDAIIFTLLAAFFGMIDTVYQIAFMSLFPEAIPAGQHQKAYSLSSLLWPVASAVMMPVAALVIDTFEYGLSILFAFNALTYFIAAILETTMKFKETLNKNPVVKFQFIEDFREGFKYYQKERGILGIGILFAAFSLVYSAHDLLLLPIFETTPNLSFQFYSYALAANSVGRIIGGLIHYRFTYPPKKRFMIAIFVYFAVEIIGATYLFLPLFLILSLSFLTGLLAVTSFNIRMSATQAYIPGQMRGRINSTQGFLSNIGYILGTLAIGLLAENSGWDFRFILLGVACVSISAIFLIPLRMHKDFKKIYNAEI